MLAAVCLMSAAHGRCQYQSGAGRGKVAEERTVSCDAVGSVCDASPDEGGRREASC